MHKKLLVGLVLALSIIFTFSVCFAADENHSLTNGIRNVVGGAENAMEDAAKGIGNAAQNTGNAIRDGASAVGNTVENGAKDAGNAVKDSMNKAGNSIENGANAVGDAMNGDDNYTATRTSADNTFMGMDSTVWTWLVLGIAAIAIIALVWYYSAQLNTNNDDHE